MPISLLVHDKGDSVGVVVVEGIENAQALEAAFIENGEKFNIDCNAGIAIGHKVALKDLRSGDTVIKYGEDIGKVVADIKKGDHVHVHNIKTKRW